MIAGCAPRIFMLLGFECRFSFTDRGMLSAIFGLNTMLFTANTAVVGVSGPELTLMMYFH